jgi:ectoine hydroxylase-related dioxygenase (phytanoyl-CoA dioxygenase family)
MMIPTDYPQQVQEHGFAVIESCLSSAEVSHLRAAVHAAIAENQDDVSVRDRGGVYAIRNLTEVVPEIRALHAHPGVARIVEPILGSSALLVRGLLFDKSEGANWGIFWHQDLSIATRARVDVAGFGPWSVKAGIPHVQPPVEVLSSMLTVRLHLDPCRTENGALRVFPGSHRAARLSMSATDELKRTLEPVTCEVDTGGVLAMRPLLLHSSHRAERPGHRRVIHLEFASGPLPEPLEWHLADPIGAELGAEPRTTGG